MQEHPTYFAVANPLGPAPMIATRRIDPTIGIDPIAMGNQDSRSKSSHRHVVPDTLYRTQ